MVTYFRRSIVLPDSRVVTRNVVVKQGVATVNYANSKQVVKCAGSASDKSALWRVA